jgi:hypothetical protein
MKITPNLMGPDLETLADIRLENELVDRLPAKVREALKTCIGALTLPQIETLVAYQEAGMLNEDQLWQMIEQADQRLRPGTKLGFTPALKRRSPKR